MLEELHVAGLALIEDAWVEPGPRLTVLTGETGAGKTVLVGALKLLLGERADANMVRAGAEEAVVEGRFRLDGVERTARRRVSAEGRSRCYLDSEMSTVAGLADALGGAVDLHGQHDHQALLTTASHAAYLDRFIGADALAALESYRVAWGALVTRVRERDVLGDALRDRQRQLEDLGYLVREVDAVGPAPGEREEIERRLPRLRHGEKLAEAASAAFAHLRGEGGAADRLSEARSALAAVSGLDPDLDEVAAALDEAAATIDDVGSRVRDRGEAATYDPAALNEAEARLAALTALARKYGPTLEGAIAAREKAAERIEALEAGEDGLRKADEAVDVAERELVAAADRLSAVREHAAADLAARLETSARELAMPKARFEVSLATLERPAWTTDGPQRVEFLFSSAAGEPVRPLARIASGGEVSRVMLALKGVLGSADIVPILVFDEVDSGIGGATALAVGRRLADLAARHQVLVVTHLAQVAAFADTHLVVEKNEEGGRAATRVRAVAGEERVGEIARMLSGSDTAAGLAHARELLGSVGAPGV